MKKLMLLALLMLSGFMATAADLWQTDFKAAQKIAVAQKKPMMLLFTGSDWCPWCKYLDRDVLTKPVFKKYAKKEIVPVFLDFPRGKEISAELKAQNEQLARRYGVRGFPTIIVTDAQGKELGKLGYMKSAKAFVNKLKATVK